MEKNLSTTFFDFSQSQSSLKIIKNLSCFCEISSSEKNDTESSIDETHESEVDHVKKSIWETIQEESRARAASYEQWIEENREIETENVGSPSDYLEKEIFPILLAGLKEILERARELDVLKVQKCPFNGLDALAEYLWNKNPKRSMRNEWLPLFENPVFKLCLKLHPRPLFPKSWLWTPEEAALRIQSYVRGWLIRKQEDVQELRQFWKIIREDSKIHALSILSSKSKVLDVCERYKLLAKKRERPF